MSMRKVGAVIGIAALLAWAPTQADAQQEQFYFEAHGGTGIGLGAMDHLTDLGASFGADIGYWVHERIALKVFGDASFLSGRDVPGSPDAGDEIFLEAPDWDLYHYALGAELLVTEPASPLEIRWGAGVGATTFETDELPGGLEIQEREPPNRLVSTGETEFDETELSVTTDLKVGYAVSPRFTVFAGGRAWVAFPDRANTRVFDEIAEQVDEDGFDTLWDVPVFAGVKIGF